MRRESTRKTLQRSIHQKRDTHNTHFHLAAIRTGAQKPHTQGNAGGRKATPCFLSHSFTLTVTLTHVECAAVASSGATSYVRGMLSFFSIIVSRSQQLFELLTNLVQRGAMRRLAGQHWQHNRCQLGKRRLFSLQRVRESPVA